MRPARFNRVVHAQLDQLLREGLLDRADHEVLAARHPVGRWDWRSLGRWFLIFGAISAVAGVVLIVRAAFDFSLEELAACIALATAGLFAAGRRTRAHVWTSRSLELMGGLGIVALTFTLGALYSSGSGNWPTLLLLDLPILLALAYALRNVLLLVLSAVVFFTGFGGVTGYVSGWGAYWFGMNYPVRFLLAGIAIAGVGVLHRRAERAWLARHPGFFQVWLASGVFFAEMALWLTSLFGNHGLIADGGVDPSPFAVFAFNVLWAGGNAALLWLGARHGVRMLRGFAVTYLVIQGYTLFFRYVAVEIGAILALAIAGGAALGLVAWLERRRRESAHSPNASSRPVDGSGTTKAKS